MGCIEAFEAVPPRHLCTAGGSGSGNFPRVWRTGLGRAKATAATSIVIPIYLSFSLPKPLNQDPKLFVPVESISAYYSTLTMLRPTIIQAIIKPATLRTTAVASRSISTSVARMGEGDAGAPRSGGASQG